MGDKTRSRLAEMLGVGVGEKFAITRDDEIPVENVQFFVNEDGHFLLAGSGSHGSCVYGAASFLCYAINHPESIIRAPRLTEAEIAIMRAMGAKWVSRDKNGTCANLWESEPHLTADGYAKAKMIANVFRGRFPSVKPGDCFCAEGDW